jgi:hypothetical protein
VYIADPTYTPTKKNTSGIVLQTAPWTQQTATISQTDKEDIALETVAAMNDDPPDVNIAKINDEVIVGTGVQNDPWKPA